MLVRPKSITGARAPHRSTFTRHGGLHVVCSVRARWCIDVRYGCKQDATALLQEWVKDIGSTAGLSSSNTRISSGAIGVPESRLELEVSFNSLAEWEQFLGSIPFKDHKAWSQRIQSMVTNDDSPKWEVFRVVPVDLDTPSITAAASATASSAATRRLPSGILTFERQEASSFTQSIVEAQSAASSITPAPLPELTMIEDSAAAEVILDWKGDPMKINPGDKFPFKFL